MKKLKLLSPAGSLEALQAAINNGADVVYLGVKNFNARRKNKGNLTFETLPAAIQLAHFHGVEINLTLNTLIKNNELNLWFKALDKAYEAGVDAVIVQDIYLLPFIKERYPDLKVHISTQASIMNYAGLKNWQQYADLAVVARELDFNELRYISERSQFPIEIFCHGHLCISYSGQCLISSLIGKRSGNRGLCASSCRKEYNKEGFLLSPKDLALLNQIPKIIESGVHTIKIEGRMKSPEYVGVVTKCYREAIDRYYSGNWKKFTQEDFDRIRMSFNRDFTTGFFLKNEYKEVLSTTLPTHRGIFLGEVHNKKIKLLHELYIHDGIGFWDKRKGEMKGEFVQKLLDKNGKIIKHAIKGQEVQIPNPSFREGARVYLTSQSKGKPLAGKNKRYPLALSISQAEIGKALELNTNWKGKEHIFASKDLLQQAKTSALNKETIEEKLNKNNFFTITLEGKLPKNLFLPSSSITQIKEELNSVFLPKVARTSPGMLRAEEILEKGSKTKNKGEKKTQESLNIRVNSLELLKIVAKKANTIYYDIFSPGFAKAKQLTKKLNPKAEFFAFTHLTLSDADIKKILILLEKEKPGGIMIANHGLYRVDKELKRSEGTKGLPKLKKHLFYTMNVFNDIDLQEVKKENASPIVSIELNAKELAQFKDKDFMVFAHGRPVVMNFKGAREEKKLTDEKKITFPLLITPNQNTEMRYSRKVALLDKIKVFKEQGIKHFYLEFLREDYCSNKLLEKAKEEVQAYKKILDGEDPGDISLLKKGTTIGNFNKGVM